MNAVTFSQILTDLPDEIIDAAAKPACGKPVLRYSLPAIAAGIVLLIAAAVYPKLRTQLPEVTAPPAETAVTTAAVTSEAAQTVTTGTYIAVTDAQASGTYIAFTKVQTTGTQSAAAVRQTETAAPAAVTQTVTKPHTTETTAVSTTIAGPVPATTANDAVYPGIEAETSLVQSQEIRVPILRAEPVSYSSIDEQPQDYSCSFHEASDADLAAFGDAAEVFDRSAYTLICAEISGHFPDATFRHGSWVSGQQYVMMPVAYPWDPDVSFPGTNAVSILLAFPKELNIRAAQLRTTGDPMPQLFYDRLLSENAEFIPYYP